MSNHFSLVFLADKYFAPVDQGLEGCGGGQPDATAVAAETASLNFNQQLMGIFSQQYQTQQQQLQFLQGKLEPMITNPTGYSAQELASQRTAATDTNAQQYQNAEVALNNRVTDAAGGSKLAGVAGTTTEADAALLNAKAQTDAASQEQITANNAALKQQNYWNAVNSLNGVAAQESPIPYGSLANGAIAGVAQNSEANTAHIQATNSPLGAVLGGAIGGGVSSLFSGAGNAGGFGALFCHCFASFFGWNDIRTWVMRMWLQTEAPRWFRNFYMQYSERISKTPARWVFYPIAAVVLARV